MRTVAAKLTAEGVPTTNGKPWNENYLANRLIKNPIYYGARRNGGQLETEELVSATTWQQANAALKTRARPGRDASVRDKALLAPICGECYGQPRGGCLDGRSPMYRIYGGKVSNRQPYYRCSGHGPQRKGCGFMILVSEADDLVTCLMLQDEHEHQERVFVAGDDKSDEIARLREKAMDAYREGNKPLFRNLDAQADELEEQNRNRTKPHWEKERTGEAEGDYFGALDLEQQRQYLASKQVFLFRGYADVQDPDMGGEDPWL